MTVRVKAIGWTKSLAGESEKDFSFSGGSLADFIRSMTPKLDRGQIDRNLFVVLVNGKSVSSDSYQLSNGDTITLFPIVSGG